MTSEPRVAAGRRPPSDLDRAADLGRRLADLIDEPDDFVLALEAGLIDLFDPVYARSLARVSPDVRSPCAVRAPVARAIEGPVRVSLGQGSSASAVSLAARLVRAEVREVRMFARPCLLRALKGDPERAWQVMRQLGSVAEDWIEVDALALPWAIGVLSEPFRWAEIEQLVFSPNVIERRLVGATLATMTHRSLPSAPVGGIGSLGPRAIGVIGQLIGDAEPLVQKALAWALRSWLPVAPVAGEAFLREQAAIAVARADGHRAWVIREALPAAPPGLALELRDRLRDVRRRPGAPSSSGAAAMAGRFDVGARALVAPGQGERYARVQR